MNSHLWARYFKGYLKKAPLSLAVWRAGEAVALEKQHLNVFDKIRTYFKGVAASPPRY